MYFDYFLTHRALQVQQLCASEQEPRIDLPSRLSRTLSSKLLVELCHTIDDICRLPSGDETEPNAGGWARFRSRFWGARQEEQAEEVPQDKPMLTADKRELINQLETNLVRVRISEDSAAVEFAAGVMQAIWANQDFFNGLKPMSFHTDAFAYEFLYPTWFNLYAACTGMDQTAKLTLDQLRVLYRFLDAYENQGVNRDPELIGLMTLIANRFPSEEALPLLQRLIDLCGCPESDLSLSAFTTVRPLRDAARSVPELLLLVKHYLLVESSLKKASVKPVYELVPGGCPGSPLPEVVGKVLRELEPNLGTDQSYTTMLYRVGQFLDCAGGFHSDFEQVLNRNEGKFSELLGLMYPSKESPAPLPAECQGLVAKLIDKEQEAGGQLDVARFRAFARQLAPRMTDLDESLRTLWETEFVNSPANRRILLDSCGDPTKRTQIAVRLLAAAKKISDNIRLFDLLELAAIIDSRYDSQRLQKMRLSARVMRLTIGSGFILQGQLADLVDDLQQHTNVCLGYLENPARIAASKNERLSKIYLVWNQERENFAATGRIGNFAITMASFSNLNRLIREEGEAEAAEE